MAICDKFTIKKHTCDGYRTTFTKWREYQDSSIGKPEAEQKAKSKISSAWGQKYADTLVFENVSPSDGTKKKLGEDPTRYNPPNAECCGDKDQNKGDGATTLVSKTPMAPRRRPIGGGSPVGEGKVTRKYTFSYVQPILSQLNETYRAVREQYTRYRDPEFVREKFPNCCGVATGSVASPTCTERCIRIIQQRAENQINRLDSLFNSKDWDGLAKALNIKIPTRMAKTVVDITEPTTDYLEELETKETYSTPWHCEKDDTRPCCECSDCDCQKLCNPDAPRNGCGPNETCVGKPDCYAHPGCCENDCAQLCQEDADCFVYPGETCKDGCCWDGDCRYGPWGPDPSTKCEGEEFQQTRPLLNGALETCPEKTRTSYGTKTCSEIPTTTNAQLNQMLYDLLIRNT